MVLMKDLARQEMRFEQVKRFLASDMTAKEWCELNHLAPSTLYLWMARFREAQSELGEEISTRQKNKNTGQWVEVSRAGISNSTALACAAKNESASVVSLQATAKLVAENETVALSAQTITVALNGAVVGIPTNADEHSISCVLKAVAAL